MFNNVLCVAMIIVVHKNKNNLHQRENVFIYGVYLHELVNMRMYFSMVSIYMNLFILNSTAGADPGGGPGPPLSENLGIDFYSGFRNFFHVYTFIVASEKKNTRGGCNSKS